MYAELGHLTMSSVHNNLSGRKQPSSLTRCSRRRGGAKKRAVGGTRRKSRRPFATHPLPPPFFLSHTPGHCKNTRSKTSPPFFFISTFISDLVLLTLIRLPRCCHTCCLIWSRLSACGLTAGKKWVLTVLCN